MQYLQYIIAFIVNYYLSKLLITKIFEEKKNNLALFKKALFVSFLIITIIYLTNHFLFDFQYTNRGDNVLYDDELQYLTTAKSLISNHFIWAPHFHVDWALAWVYLLALNSWIFGIHYYTGVIINIFLFSLSALLFYNIVLKVHSEKKIAEKSFYLFIFFIPLLFISSTILKEMLITFLTLFVIYSFMELKENKRPLFFSILLLTSYILMFLTRHQYAIVLGSLIILFYLFTSHKNIFIKSIYLFIFIIGVYFFYNSPFVKGLYLTELIEYSNIRAITYSSTEVVQVKGGYFQYFLEFISDPWLFRKQIIFGSISYLLDPLPYRFLQSEDPFHFWSSIYNIFFYLFLPSIFFGLFFKIKEKKINSYDLFLLAYFVIMFFILILNARAVIRYRVSYFPLLLVWGSFGLHHFSKWKRFVPIITILYIFLFLFFTVFYNINKIFQ
jgi:hypothetical protein